MFPNYAFHMEKYFYSSFCCFIYFQGKSSPLLNMFPLAQAPVFFATDLEEVLLILFISLNVILRTHIL